MEAGQSQAGGSCHRREQMKVYARWIPAFAGMTKLPSEQARAGGLGHRGVIWVSGWHGRLARVTGWKPVLPNA